MKELESALRQYQHNDCSGFVAGYDKEEVEAAFTLLKYKLHNEICGRLTSDRRLKDMLIENKKLQDEINRLNFVIKNRKAIAPE